ncbi:hypothetical protein NDU88_000993 [Pleurodeles waltl]|uniref:Uncharacterized protein n=1 Tax=Pleurodeles waltl TaxID=8319 RepID=A0AAV7SY02_PLEWA|nr:hypothetical protein NDU88_000993 [Pleurodeles waltl]
MVGAVTWNRSELKVKEKCCVRHGHAYDAHQGRPSCSGKQWDLKLMKERGWIILTVNPVVTATNSQSSTTWGVDMQKFEPVHMAGGDCY